MKAELGLTTLNGHHGLSCSAEGSLMIIIVVDIEILCRPLKRNYRHCVDTEKALCTQGNSAVATQEVLTSCQSFQNNKETLSTQENCCVLKKIIVC